MIDVAVFGGETDRTDRRTSWFSADGMAVNRPGEWIDAFDAELARLTLVHWPWHDRYGTYEQIDGGLGGGRGNRLEKEGHGGFSATWMPLLHCHVGGFVNRVPPEVTPLRASTVRNEPTGHGSHGRDDDDGPISVPSIH